MCAHPRLQTLGTREVYLIHHTDCGFTKFSNPLIHGIIKARSPIDPSLLLSRQCSAPATGPACLASRRISFTGGAFRLAGWIPLPQAKLGADVSKWDFRPFSESALDESVREDVNQLATSELVIKARCFAGAGAPCQLWVGGHA